MAIKDSNDEVLSGGDIPRAIDFPLAPIADVSTTVELDDTTLATLEAGTETAVNNLGTAVNSILDCLRAAGFIKHP